MSQTFEKHTIPFLHLSEIGHLLIGNRILLSKFDIKCVEERATLLSYQSFETLNGNVSAMVNPSILASIMKDPEVKSILARIQKLPFKVANSLEFDAYEDGDIFGCIDSITDPGLEKIKEVLLQNFQELLSKAIVLKAIALKVKNSNRAYAPRVNMLVPSSSSSLSGLVFMTVPSPKLISEAFNGLVKLAGTTLLVTKRSYSHIDIRNDPSGFIELLENYDDKDLSSSVEVYKKLVDRLEKPSNLKPERGLFYYDSTHGHKYIYLSQEHKLNETVKENINKYSDITDGIQQLLVQTMAFSTSPANKRMEAIKSGDNWVSASVGQRKRDHQYFKLGTYSFVQAVSVLNDTQNIPAFYGVNLKTVKDYHPLDGYAAHFLVVNKKSFRTFVVGSGDSVFQSVDDMNQPVALCMWDDRDKNLQRLLNGKETSRSWGLTVFDWLSWPTVKVENMTEHVEGSIKEIKKASIKGVRWILRAKKLKLVVP